MRRILALMAATLAIALVGCSDDPSPARQGGEGGTGGTGGSSEGGSGGTPSQEIGSIEISVEGCDIGCEQLSVGDTIQLIATVRGPEGEVLPDIPVQWASSDPEIATVTDGLVHALESGFFEVVATAGGLSETAGFRVTHVRSIRIFNEFGAYGTLSAIPGKTLKIVAETYGGGFTPMPIYGVSVDWSISPEGVVEVVEETAHDDFPALLLRTLVPGEATLVASITREDQRIEESIQLVVLDPVASPAEAFFDELSAGGNGSGCGLSAGTGFCWGSNLVGQLGLGNSSVETEPVPMAGGILFDQIALGDVHGCGLDRDGAAWCWGANYVGQLGIGVTGDGSLVPAAVTGGLRFSSIAAKAHSCAIDGDGAAFCWGPNFAGQLGTGGTQSALGPTRVTGGHLFRVIAPGGSTTCALDLQGKAWCWGSHQSSLGVGNDWAGQPPENHKSPMPVRGDHVFTTLDASMSHTCALDEEGTAFCWGNNGQGQLGTPSTGFDDHRWEPTRVEGVPPLASVVVGNGHGCGLARDGDAWCWGGNLHAQLGAGDQDPHEGPVQVLGGLAFRQLATSGDATCGLATDGGAFCWGHGSNGALGNGLDDGTRSVPVPMHAPRTDSTPTLSR